MNAMPTLATVDLGSNSFRLQICQNNNGQPQVIENIKQMVRFAGGLDAHKNLDAASQQRALACLAQFGERLRGFSPENVRVVATNTFRVAKNIGEFLPKAEAALGFPIEIIAGREEARLIYTGVVHTYPNNGQKMLVIDIGGGSTEFIIGSDLQPEHMESLPLGCVTYSMRFFQGKISQKDFQAAINTARAEIQRISKLYKRAGWDISIGTSGSAKAIANVIAAHGLAERGITLSAMQKLADKIIAEGSVKKAKLEGLKPERIEVFAGGLAVMMAAFQELDIKEMVFTEAALRDGLFFDFIERNLDSDMREETVIQFQERYHVSKNQAARVAKLSAQFFTGLSQHITVQAFEYWSDYVRWAALLHEVGLDIAHTAYHKHSAYILAQADMSGFSRPEQDLLSKLVLAQRGDLKKMTEIQNDKMSLWHAIFALRLAVLFCRARLPLALPANMALSHSDEQGYVLKIAQTWLDENPLTSSALESETQQWQAIGKTFTVLAN
ncbi:exopolyphosphatase [Alysiella filiformis]|uniref:Exopolyphosphatase n=1 Tax=Alysiella filiformis DSM 16848 TaxID=1120981 RepID=A0A286EHC2_9NEIS|nr:exopolyphosphatase [Alysiella filiformis]QMT32344.1 exopolyphosphatase [Alysiella filiformis]UBQ56736.1 exopolyphosphatase [Alysiella filiformis DSM 16848]SOD70219.1 exopolyphosphatase / guanosine-5'-triphosphate,3'-diphosphate pyrophosphatase [Alysiella filiformis DSM 16848]